jgi:hypothetical protein
VASPEGEFGGISFSTGKIDGFSPGIRGVNKLGEENIKAWVEYWHASGFM